MHKKGIRSRERHFEVRVYIEKKYICKYKGIKSKTREEVKLRAKREAHERCVL